MDFVRDKGKRNKQSDRGSSSTGDGKDKFIKGERIKKTKSITNNDDSIMNLSLGSVTDDHDSSFISQCDSMSPVDRSHDDPNSFMTCELAQTVNGAPANDLSSKKVPKRRRKQLDLNVLSPHVHLSPQDGHKSSGSIFSGGSVDGTSVDGSMAIGAAGGKKAASRSSKMKLHKHLIGSAERDVKKKIKKGGLQGTPLDRQNSIDLFGSGFNPDMSSDISILSDAPSTLQNAPKKKKKDKNASADETPLGDISSSQGSMMGKKKSQKTKQHRLQSPSAGCGLTPSLNNLEIGGGVSADILRQIGLSPDALMAPGGFIEGMSPFFDSPRHRDTMALYFGGQNGSMLNPTPPGTDMAISCMRGRTPFLLHLLIIMRIYSKCFI